MALKIVLAVTNVSNSRGSVNITRAQ